MLARFGDYARVSWLLPIATLACQAAAAATLEISAQMTENDSIVVRYVFDAEVTEFQFLSADDVSRDDWHVAEASLTLAGNVVSSVSGSPFTTATLTFPARQEYPRSSPTATPTSISMGTSSTVVNLTHLRVRDAMHAVTFIVHNAFDEITRACVARRTIPLDRDELARPIQRYVFASTTAEVCGAAAGNGDGAIFSSDAPAALQQLITHDFAQRYDSLRQRVGSPSKFTLFVAHKPRSNASIIRILSGAHGVVVAPLEGDAWSTPAGAEGLISSLLSNFVAEWLGGAPVAPPGRRPPQANWLASGAATYIAILNGIEQGYVEDARVKSRIGFIDICARWVTSALRNSIEVPPIARSAGDCGLLVQLVYDAITRAESGGERTIYDLWAEALATRDGRHGVDPAAFVATNPRAEAALAGLLYGPEADLGGIVTALQRAGVDAVLRDSPDPGGAVIGLLRPFLMKACPEAPLGMGFDAVGTGASMSFDLRDSCDRLPSKFSFIRIESRGIYSPPREIFEAVERACGSRGAITLTGTTATLPELTLDCPEQLPKVPLGLQIRDLGVLLR
jgi:hypothetical protein